MSRTDILIVGAGPTGLILAHWLKALGAPFRIIDKAKGPGEQSRALAVHARTLELYRQLGLAEGAIERGFVMPRFSIWRDRERVSETVFGQAGEGLTPYPFVLIFPQDDHEHFLAEQLRLRGAKIEWRTELADLVEAGSGWRATLQGERGEEIVDARFVCGCDGAHSAVRHHLGVEFRGGTYDETFFVADVEAMGTAADRAFNLCVDADGLCVVAPVRRSGSHRLVGLVPDDKKEKAEPTFKDVQPMVRRVTGLTVNRVNWFSGYRAHHRVADKFALRGAFLLGDAAHVHSPVGGQGMNTGIGDASNLAWKLADVIHGQADVRLLDSYAVERQAFARQLLATTDQAFKRMTARTAMGRMFRSNLMPTLLPLIAGAAPTRRTAFRVVSQLAIAYHKSPLSAGGAGRVRGGDRLPLLELERGDNFETLKALDWQIQVYGRVKAKTEAAAAELGLTLNRFRFDKPAERAGFMKDALYLVRPDGYVAFAEPGQNVKALSRFLRRNGLNLEFGGTAGGATDPALDRRRAPA